MEKSNRVMEVMVEARRNAETAKHSYGIYSSSGSDELFFALEAPHDLGFTEGLHHLFATYKEYMREHELSLQSEIVLKFHLSDIANQGEYLQQYLNTYQPAAFIAMVGQESCLGSKIAMEAYHLRTDNHFSKKSHQDLGTIEVSHGAYHSLWSSYRPQKAQGVFDQTTELFSNLAAKLRGSSCATPPELIRTWIYLRDIDLHYRDMVDARTQQFDKMGLTRKTHYVASTGIEGRSQSSSHLVMLDALAVAGLHPTQITHLDAPTHMCPTHDYQVTFERGTRLTYGDRSHYYISGTASIDNQGKVLFPHDVMKQAERVLINMDALLASGGATLADLKHVVVYLRDFADKKMVQDFLSATLPSPS